MGIPEETHVWEFRQELVQRLQQGRDSDPILPMIGLLIEFATAIHRDMMTRPTSDWVANVMQRTDATVEAALKKLEKPE